MSDQGWPPPGGSVPPPPPGGAVPPPPPGGSVPPPPGPPPGGGGWSVPPAPPGQPHQPYVPSPAPPASPTPDYSQTAPGYQPVPAYGGPGQPPPNYGYGTLPPPPGAKKTRWPWIVVGVILAGLLLIGGCVALVVRLASGPIDAANEFLADIAAEDYTAALAHLDPSCFGAGEASPDALQIFFGDSVTGYNLTSTSNDNNRTGSAGGTITRDGFGTQPVSFAMTKPADDWLVCGYRIGS